MYRVIGLSRPSVSEISPTRAAPSSLAIIARRRSSLRFAVASTTRPRSNVSRIPSIRLP